MCSMVSTLSCTQQTKAAASKEWLSTYEQLSGFFSKQETQTADCASAACCLSSSSLRRQRAAAIRLAAGGEAKLAKEVAACGSVNTQPAAARWINMAAFLDALMSNVIVTHLCDPVMSSDTLSHFNNLSYTACQGCHTPGTQAGYQLS